MVSALAQRAPSFVTDKDGKRPRTLTVETWKKLLRLRRDAQAEGFKTTFSCPDCGDPITMTVPHPTEPRLACRCTTWIGR